MEEERDKGMHLPGWVREWAIKLLPWLTMAILGASVNLYISNLAHQKDIDRNSWRLDKLEAQSERTVARLDAAIADINDLLNNQREFHPEVIERLQYLRDLLEKERRRR